MKRVWRASLVFAFGGIVAACGGSTSTVVDSADASAGGDGGTVGNDGGGNGDGSAAGDGAATGDAIAPGGDGGSPGDAGPGGTQSTISCGNTSCMIPGSVCCVSDNGRGVFSYACNSGTTCALPDGGNAGNGTTALACTSAANCAANTVCCATVDPNNNSVTSSCQATCAGMNSAQLCDPLAMPTGCTQAAPCSSNNIGDWGLPPTFGTCGGKSN